MKKVLFVLPAVLALSACGGVTSVGSASVPDIPFSADAEISYNGTECSARITRSESGRWEFCITSPYALEGLTMKVDNGSTTLSMFGSEASADISGDAVSMAKAAAAAYDAAAASGDAPAVTEKGYLLSGTSDAGSFTVEFDKVGTPVLFTADRLSVSISGIRELPPAEREAQIIE